MLMEFNLKGGGRGLVEEESLVWKVLQATNILLSPEENRSILATLEPIRFDASGDFNWEATKDKAPQIEFDLVMGGPPRTYYSVTGSEISVKKGCEYLNQFPLAPGVQWNVEHEVIGRSRKKEVFLLKQVGDDRLPNVWILKLRELRNLKLLDGEVVQVDKKGLAWQLYLATGLVFQPGKEIMFSGSSEQMYFDANHMPQRKYPHAKTCSIKFKTAMNLQTLTSYNIIRHGVQITEGLDKLSPLAPGVRWSIQWDNGQKKSCFTLRQVGEGRLKQRWMFYPHRVMDASQDV